jgi:hypothetical protein
MDEHDLLDQTRHARLWELYDEIVMLLAVELGLDINQLTEPVIEAGEGWTFLLHDLVAQASPITNPRIVNLLKEYDELDSIFWNFAISSLR